MFDDIDEDVHPVSLSQEHHVGLASQPMANLFVASSSSGQSNTKPSTSG
jgi:hypothetical protein